MTTSGVPYLWYEQWGLLSVEDSEGVIYTYYSVESNDDPNAVEYISPVIIGEIYPVYDFSNEEFITVDIDSENASNLNDENYFTATNYSDVEYDCLHQSDIYIGYIYPTAWTDLSRSLYGIDVREEFNITYNLDLDLADVNFGLRIIFGLINYIDSNTGCAYFIQLQINNVPYNDFTIVLAIGVLTPPTTTILDISSFTTSFAAVSSHEIDISFESINGILSINASFGGVTVSAQVNVDDIPMVSYSIIFESAYGYSTGEYKCVKAEDGTLYISSNTVFLATASDISNVTEVSYNTTEETFIESIVDASEEGEWVLLQADIDGDGDTDSYWAWVTTDNTYIESTWNTTFYQTLWGDITKPWFSVEVTGICGVHCVCELPIVTIELRDQDNVLWNILSVITLAGYGHGSSEISISFPVFTGVDYENISCSIPIITLSGAGNCYAADIDIVIPSLEGGRYFDVDITMVNMALVIAASKGIFAKLLLTRINETSTARYMYTSIPFLFTITAVGEHCTGQEFPMTNLDEDEIYYKYVYLDSTMLSNFSSYIIGL